MNIQVPFYSNTPDNTHCYQAVIKVLAKYFWPKENYTWDELDHITAKVKGLWTWPLAGVLWLRQKGVNIAIIEPFDYTRFIQEKGDYLISEYGEEVGKSQIYHSDIAQEVAYTKKVIQEVTIEQRIPDKTDLINYLKKGYLLICNVNSKTLISKQGYTGHYVLIKGFDGKYLYAHDPGLPPRENNKISVDLFEKAWTYPNNKAKNIFAFKLRSKSDSL